MSKIPVHSPCNLNNQKCIEITESKQWHRALKSNNSCPTSISSFHMSGILLCEEEEEKKPTEIKKQNREKSNIISIHIIFALWITAGHRCCQRRANIAKNSHCFNIFIFRTDKVSREWQERPQIHMQKSLGGFPLSQLSPPDHVSPGRVQRKGEGHFHRVQLVLKKSQFSECWHFSDRNKQCEFVLQ